MTTHLTPEERIDALDGALDPARALHAESCETCRAAVDDLRAAMARAADADVPEPSPLFWDHFSARVRQATAVDETSRQARNWRPWLATAAALAAVVLVVTMRWPRAVPVPVEEAPSSRAAASAPSAGEPASDAEPWSAVVQAAADLSADDVRSALSLSADASPLVEDLTPAERAAFVRLLHAEMERTQ
jgi:hypothetical protein